MNATTRAACVLGLTLGLTSLGRSDAVAVPLFFGGNAYEFVAAGLSSWPVAKVAAEAQVFGGANGHLVTILSAAENDFVLGLLTGVGNSVWVGATDEAVEGEWRWVTGEQFWQGNASGAAVLFANWAPGQPDDYASGQDYATMLAPGATLFPGQSPGQWDDTDGLFSGYVVEFENASPVPEPSTMMLFGTGAVVLARIRRRKKL